jgi:hypothetical protein
VEGLLASSIDEAEATVDNFATYARVSTLVAQRLRSETYESPALPLSYSAANSCSERQRACRTNTARGYLSRMAAATRARGIVIPIGRLSSNHRLPITDRRRASKSQSQAPISPKQTSSITP